jgi:hypothetical protein
MDGLKRLPCNHKVPYASATFCINFKKDTKKVRTDKVKKYKMCPKCLKKAANHTIPECKARPCKICGGEHNDMICDQDGGEQEMFHTKEEDGQGGNGNPEDSDNNGGAAQDEAEKMFQLEEQEANDAYEEPREDEELEESDN